MTDDALAFWIVAAGRGEIRAETLPPAAAGEVVVEALYSGISRGSESLVFQGRVPISEHQRMRAPFQAGDFPAPVKYGYCSVGRVVSGSPALQDRIVFSLFPHQSRYVVPAAAVHLVPDDVPARRAILAANMETALNGVWDAGILPGDRVAVVGGGTVGCLVAWLAGRIAGCDVELVDVNTNRAATVTALGVGFATPESASGNADVVVHASGSPSGLSTALRLAGFETTVLEMSWYGSQVVTAPLGEAFHAQRLTLKSSQVGRVAAAQRARWTTDRRLRLALSLLRDPALDLLITGETPLADLPRVMASLADGAGDTLCHAVRY